MNHFELEKANPLLKTIDFLSMNTMESAGFAHAVKRHDGNAWLMVHSDFRRSGNLFDGNEPFSPPEWYIQRRNAFYERALSQHFPVINLEAASTLGRMSEIIRTPISGTLYTIQTRHEQSPYPKAAPALCTWGAVPDLLRQAGVTTVTLGGCLLDWSEPRPDRWSLVRIGADAAVPSQVALEQMQSWVTHLSQNLETDPHAPGWVQNGKIPQSCVGVTGLDMLREGFDVVFSDVVASEGDSTVRLKYY